MRGAVAMLGRLVLAGAGAAFARVLLTAASVPAAPVGTNFRGRRVSLAGGPALAVAASLAAGAGAALGDRRELAAAALVGGLGAGAVGRYDDMAGARPGHHRVGYHSAKGFRGHVGALREGRITSGLVKIVGIGAAGLAASALLPSRARTGVGRAAEVALGAGVVAGTANLMNLLDLRPGRALKAGLIVGVALLASPVGSVVAGPVGAAAALLGEDLDERVMLGDAGANALGAVLGVALAARTGLLARAALLLGLGAATAASERVSFTAVIERTPGLRELDRLGRRN